MSERWWIEVLRTFGRIDILVNNAGIIRRGTIETVTEEDWDRVIAINLKGTFNCCRAVVGAHEKAGRWENREHLLDCREDGGHHLRPRIRFVQGRG